MSDAWSAESVGSLLVARSWSGSVASVHTRALNILRPDGLVVSLLPDRKAMTDLGIVVPDLFTGRLPDLSGRTVTARHGRLRIDGLGLIDLRTAMAWSGRIHGSATAVRRGASAVDLAGILARHGRPGGLLGLAAPSRDSLWSAAVRRSLEADPPDPSALVGLGPGMTPSGDDFLAGALLALHLGWRRLPRGLSPARLCRAIAAALPRTAPTGRTLLHLALRGRFAAPLLELATAARCGDVAEAARTLCEFGETSGTDTLVGFWWACARSDALRAKQSGRGRPTRPQS